jgi:hypothetical protein
MKQEIKDRQEARFRNTGNMRQRYKAWAENLASLVALMVVIGEEVGGEQFLRKVEEAIFEGSKLDVERHKEAAGIAETETAPDCLAIGRLLDIIDDSLANFWDGYIEKSPKVFEKRVVTCPVAEAFSMAPVICERVIASGLKGYVKALNPKAQVRFTDLMPKGDDACRYRIEITD